MKKRNWLMTIAFAVLSLTIISTCVIGSTYAKFVSKVSGSGSAQAAGFSLTAGSTVAKDENVLMAPSVTAEYEMTVNYFSQVVTKITDQQAGSSMTGKGVFDPTKWAELVTFYNAHYNDIVVALGLGTVSGSGETATVTLNSGITGGKVKTDLKPSELVTVTVNDGDALAAVKKALNDSTKVTATDVAAAGSDPAYLSVTAMGKDETTPIAINLTVKATWTTLADTKGGDVFDTFIGNCIAAMAQGVALTYGGDDAAHTAVTAGTATKSEVGIALGLAAEQIITAPSTGD